MICGTRRLFVAMVTLLAAVVPCGFAAAQDATPAADSSMLAALDLPALDLVISDAGIEYPGELVAGAYVVTVTNTTDAALTTVLAQLPDGITVDDLTAEISAESTSAWMAEAVLAGTIDTVPGGTERAVMLLDGGSWTVAAASGDPEATPEPVRIPGGTLVVTGNIDPAVASTIPADIDVGYGAYVFDFPDTMPAGSHVWHIANTHAIPHHAVIFPADRLYTPDEALSGLMAMFSGTPEPDGFTLDGPPVYVAPALSGGQQTWVEVNLDPGAYVAVCFFSDPGSDVPHVAAGMIDTFEVTGQ